MASCNTTTRAVRSGHGAPRGAATGAALVAAGRHGNADKDCVWLPDQNGTKFDVVFVERVGRGGGRDVLRVYLVRGTPGWPTSQL